MISMNMSVKRKLLMDCLRTVMQDEGMTLHVSEEKSLQKWMKRDRFMGDMLTESICLMGVLFAWYETAAEACEDLPANFFVGLFSWALREEEKIRSRPEGPRKRDQRILDAMGTYISKIRRSQSSEEVSQIIMGVLLARKRGVKTATRIGWYSGVPQAIVSYLSAAHTVMPAISIRDLLDDLIARHVSELRQMEDENWTPGVPFQEAVVAALTACESTLMQPWAVEPEQQSLW